MRSSSGGHANRSLACTRRMPFSVMRTCVVSSRCSSASNTLASRRTRSSDASFTARCSPASTRDVSGTKAWIRKRPPGCRCRGDVGEAAHLRLLRVELEERVEHDEHERELAVDRDVGHVADRDGDRVAARLGAQLLDHRGRRVDAVHLDAARRERERRPGPVPMPSSSARPPCRELGQQRDLGGGVDRLVPLVVDVGDPLAVGFGPEVLHRPIVGIDHARRRRINDHRSARGARRGRARSKPPATTASTRSRASTTRSSRCCSRPSTPSASQLTTAVAIAFARNPMTLAQIGLRPAARVAAAGSTSGSARRSSRTSRSGSRCSGRSPAARMRELVLAIRAIWARWHDGTQARLPRRVLHAHADDAVLQSRARARTACRRSSSPASARA